MLIGGAQVVVRAAANDRRMRALAVLAGVRGTRVLVVAVAAAWAAAAATAVAVAVRDVLEHAEARRRIASVVGAGIAVIANYVSARAFAGRAFVAGCAAVVVGAGCAVIAGGC